MGELSKQSGRAIFPPEAMAQLRHNLDDKSVFNQVVATRLRALVSSNIQLIPPEQYAKATVKALAAEFIVDEIADGLPEELLTRFIGGVSLALNETAEVSADRRDKDQRDLMGISEFLKAAMREKFGKDLFNLIIEINDFEQLQEVYDSELKDDFELLDRKAKLTFESTTEMQTHLDKVKDETAGLIMSLGQNAESTISGNAQFYSRKGKPNLIQYGRHLSKIAEHNLTDAKAYLLERRADIEITGLTKSDIEDLEAIVDKVAFDLVKEQVKLGNYDQANSVCDEHVSDGAKSYVRNWLDSKVLGTIRTIFNKTENQLDAVVEAQGYAEGKVSDSSQYKIAQITDSIIFANLTSMLMNSRQAWAEAQMTANIFASDELMATYMIRCLAKEFNYELKEDS